MEVGSPMLAGFLDELEKIAVAHGGSHVSKVRQGTRPISVDNLIAKHNDGTLLKQKGPRITDEEKTADSMGSPQNVRGDSVDDPGAAKPPRRPGEVPSKGTGDIPIGEKLGFSKKADPVRSEGPGPIPNGESPFSYQEAVKPKKKGEVPSKDDSNVIDRMDGRGEATTVTGLGQSSSNISATNHPAEHS